MRQGPLDHSPEGGGSGVTDGAKGDIVVSGGGATWTIDPALLSAFMRTILPVADEAAFKAAMNLEIGVDVQAYSAILQATTASFLTAHATKLGHISVTQAVDLDAIETRVNELDASVILKGVWDASAGTFPGAGVAQAGWSYIVSVAGTVGGVAFNVNDRIIAIVDNASTGTFAANWFKADYTDQVLTVAGKTGTVTLQVADITDMSANGRSLVSAANYAAMKTLLAITAADITDASANGRSLITAANYAAMRTLLGLVIGTNVQAWDTQLDSLASLAYAGNANKVVAVNAGATGFELVTPSGGGSVGTFTPTIAFGGAAVGVAYSIQSGAYSVQGKAVTFALRVTLSSKGSSTGAVSIRGLPFTSHGTLNQGASMGDCSQFSGLTGALIGNIDNNSTQISMAQTTSAGSAPITDASITNTTSIIISGTYIVP